MIIHQLQLVEKVVPDLLDKSTPKLTLLLKTNNKTCQKRARETNRLDATCSKRVQPTTNYMSGLQTSIANSQRDKDIATTNYTANQRPLFHLMGYHMHISHLKKDIDHHMQTDIDQELIEISMLEEIHTMLEIAMLDISHTSLHNTSHIIK